MHQLSYNNKSTTLLWVELAATCWIGVIYVFLRLCGANCYLWAAAEFSFCQYFYQLLNHLTQRFKKCSKSILLAIYQQLRYLFAFIYTLDKEMYWNMIGQKRRAFLKLKKVACWNKCAKTLNIQFYWFNSDSTQWFKKMSKWVRILWFFFSFSFCFFFNLKLCELLPPKLLLLLLMRYVYYNLEHV